MSRITDLEEMVKDSVGHTNFVSMDFSQYYCDETGIFCVGYDGHKIYCSELEILNKLLLDQEKNLKRISESILNTQGVISKIRVIMKEYYPKPERV